MNLILNIFDILHLFYLQIINVSPQNVWLICFLIQNSFILLTFVCIFTFVKKSLVLVNDLVKFYLEVIVDCFSLLNFFIDEHHLRLKGIDFYILVLSFFLSIFDFFIFAPQFRDVFIEFKIVLLLHSLKHIPQNLIFTLFFLAILLYLISLESDFMHH